MERILLFGASVRALAQSAVWAGLDPICYDLFADEDLCRIAEAHRISRKDYPNGLPCLAKQHEGCPWIYTGGLENHPTVLEEIARFGPLWGNPGPVVRKVRDPCRLRSALLEGANLVVPEISLEPADVPTDGSWLIKPLAGSSGTGIFSWCGGSLPAESYLQRHASGKPCSAVFFGRGADADTDFLGVTRQLIGTFFCNAPPFRYCGNIGPIGLENSVRKRLQKAGNVLTKRFDLRGLFGLDFLLEGSTILPLEVNPRYTASVEILEQSLGFSAISLHQGAISGQRSAVSSQRSAISSQPLAFGKAILYAPCACRIRLDAPCFRFDEEVENEKFADVPSSSVIFEMGEPILTLLAESSSGADCEHQLREASGQFQDEWLLPLVIA